LSLGGGLGAQLFRLMFGVEEVGESGWVEAVSYDGEHSNLDM